jgi:hypothetical protein
VDKTEYAYRLITEGRRYFLARPRRFGKSLFVSMLKNALEGNKSLFEGLWINSSDYDWKAHGVIALDFSGMGIHDVLSFNKGLCSELKEIADDYGIDLKIDEVQPEVYLRRLVKILYEKFGAAAILIDEYDNPILHALHNPELATEIRDATRRFFAAIKSLDTEVDFVFITGISSFSRAGVFSGMNNLQTITFNPEYAGICGYTEQEMQENFSEYVAQWARARGVSVSSLFGEIKQWYNGYRFSKSLLTMYNPFSIMHALKEQEFKNFWFLSGTPSFLIEIMKKEYTHLDVEEFNDFEMPESALGAIDVQAMPLGVLLFQAGYLTIVDYDPDGIYYKLVFPNAEVRGSFQKYLLEILLQVSTTVVERRVREFKLALQKGDYSRLKEVLLELFSHIPYQLHMKEEKYYHSLMVIICTAAGIEVVSEYSTSDGRIDLVVALQDKVYIIEIKFNKLATQALAQIKERAYYKPFLAKNKRIILLGMSFIREPKRFDIEIADEKLPDSSIS